MNPILKHVKIVSIFILAHLIILGGAIQCTNSCDSFECFGCLVFIMPFQHLIPLLDFLNLNMYGDLSARLLTSMVILLINFLTLYLILWYYDRGINKAKNKLKS